MSLVNREIRRARMIRRNEKIEHVSYGCTMALGLSMLWLLRAFARLVTWPFRRA